MTTITLNESELFQTIITESKRYSISRTKDTRYDASEVESYLVEKVWLAIASKPSYHTLQGVRKAIKTRGYNYFNKEKKHQVVTPFTCFTGAENREKGGQSGLSSLELTYVNTLSPSPEKDYFDNLNLNELLSSMSARQRLIIELSNGILDGLHKDQLQTAKEILQEKLKCKLGHVGHDCTCKFELSFTIKDIARIIGCSPRTVDNELKAVREGK